MARHRSLQRAIRSLVAGLACLWAAPLLAAQVITVNTTSLIVDGNTSSPLALTLNRGADQKISLPEAIAAANHGGNVTIHFQLPAGSQIVLAGPLEITAPRVVVDGSLNISGKPGVTILGPDGQNSLLIGGAGDAVQNLAVSGLVVVPPAVGVRISNCYIGLAADGATAQGQHVNGITLQDVHGTLILANVIGHITAANGGVNRNLFGIEADGGGDALIIGNSIGVDRNGNQIPNDVGIWLSGSSKNTIGGPRAGTICVSPCNLLSGNETNAIIIGGAGSTANVVAGNFVGVLPTGVTAMPNGRARGLFNAPAIAVVDGANGNLIGGLRLSATCSGACNLISGNDASGVMVAGAGTNLNSITGNFVGTTVSGKVALPNLLHGLEVEQGATGTTVGGNRTAMACSGPCNLVSGNGDSGVFVANAGTTGVVVAGNFIGTDILGAVALPNQNFGVEINGGATKATIGGPRATQCSRACNLISGNLRSGISASGANASMFLTVRGNVIGLDVSDAHPIPNGEAGVTVSNGAADVVLGGDAPTGVCASVCNHIAWNSKGGAVVLGAATRAKIVGNAIHDNGTLDIDLNGDGVTPDIAPGGVQPGPTTNEAVGFPMGVTSTVDGATTIISGQVDGPHPEALRIDVYAGQHARCVKPDAKVCFGSAKLYLGATSVTTNGSFRLVYPGALPLPIVSATVTTPAGSTSELSPACSDRLNGAGVVDTDGDGLCDDWEIYGLDVNGDGKPDVALDKAGALPKHKDLFLEVDYAPSATATPADASDIEAALFEVQYAFANAPLVNADGNKGVSLHFLTDPNVGSFVLDDTLPAGLQDVLAGSAPLPTETTPSFVGLRLGSAGDPCIASGKGYYGTAADRADSNCHFIMFAKQLVQRYAIIGVSYATRETAGITPADSTGMENSPSDFFVSMLHVAKLADGRNRVPVLAGTVMHELGHTLGLCHGGPLVSGVFDCPGDASSAGAAPQYSINYKPNYVSVMNYAYQDYFDVSIGFLTYSPIVLQSLDEVTGLNEIVGIPIPADPAANYLRASNARAWFARLATDGSGAHYPVDAPFGPYIDWNGVSGAVESGVKLNIHDSEDHDPNLRLLSGAADWPNLRYSFRDIPDFSNPAFGRRAEPSVAVMIALRAKSDADHDGVLDPADDCPLTPNPDQANTTGRHAGDACAIAPSTFAPVTFAAGQPGALTIALVRPAGPGGATFLVHNSLAALASQTSVTVPQGALTATVNVTVGPVTTTTTATIDILGDEDSGRIPVTISTGLSYALTDIGTLGGTYSSAYGLNDAGQVVGNAFVSGPDFNARPFLWSGGVMQALPSGNADTPSGTAADINNGGLVVGSVTTNPAGYSGPAEWTSNGLSQLPSLNSIGPGGVSRVNDAGVAVGSAFSDSDSDNHATEWLTGRISDLGTLGGSYSGASDINSSGTITGTSSGADGTYSAFIYRAGTMTALPRPSWATWCHGGAIDDAGTVYGACVGGGHLHVVTWSAGTMTDGGIVPDATGGDIQAANARGQAVGSVSTTTGLSVAILFANGKIYNLNDLIPSGSGWKLERANDINAAGVIVGDGENPAGQSHGFVLKPQ